MKINVIGLGYIGLPTAAVFAQHGVDVVGFDLNETAVELINKGKIHIEEPGLEDVVAEVVKKGKLRATFTPEESDVFIIAVPTPNNNDENLSCDLTYVLSATKSIMPYLKKGNIVIVESTIAPRTMDDYVAPLLEEAGFKIGEDIFLAHCPERVLPGQILHELIYNNRIVGGVTEKCTDKAAEVYATFVKGEIIKTEAKTAEMSKLMENTFRDVNIALANELAKVCNDLEINVLDVIKMANKHPRVNIHTPGPGVGGHCLAVDPYFIYAKSPELAKIIKLSRDTNVSMPHFVADNVEKIVKYNKEVKISAFGVTYKGNVDDMRESPSVEIIHLLQERGYNVAIHDPHVKKEEFFNFEDAVKDSELVVILTDHNEFKNMDFAAMKKLMKNFQIFDTRNIVEPREELKLFNYGNLYKVAK